MRRGLISHELESIVGPRVCGDFRTNTLPRLFSALGDSIALGKLNEGFRQREALLRRRGLVNAGQRRQPPAYAELVWRVASRANRSLSGANSVSATRFSFSGLRGFFASITGRRGSRWCARRRIAELVQDFGRGRRQSTRVEDAQQLPHHDYWVYPMRSRCGLRARTSIIYRTAVPYLRADIDHAALAEAGRRSRRALKVGVVFKGCADTRERCGARSLPSLGCLDPLFELEGIEFYIMQKGQGEDEAAEYASALEPTS